MVILSLSESSGLPPDLRSATRATELIAARDELDGIRKRKSELIAQAVRYSADVMGVRTATATGTSDFQLYGADNVTCEGAIDLTNPRGFIEIRATSTGFDFEVVLQGSEPNRRYTVTLDDCSNPPDLTNALVTDSVGSGSVSGFFSLSSGTHLIVITVHTIRPVGHPANRDMGTTPFLVIVS